MMSIICAMQEKLDMAELFLERVTAQDQENIIAWTLYAMLYEQRSQDLNAEITYKKAHKLNQNLHANDTSHADSHEMEGSILKKGEEG